MESQYSQCGTVIDWTADADYDAGAIVQLPDGRAGQVTCDVVSGDVVGVRVEAGALLKNVTKASGFVALKGNRAFWDHSANAVSYRKVNDRDFYLGRFAEDGTAAGTDTTCAVILNIDPRYDIDLLRDGALSVPTGTVAAGGFDLPKRYGGAAGLSLTATNEAQCIDMLSVDRFALGANAIIEAIFRVAANGSTSAVDLSIGVANGTSTTDADAITESVFLHIDGGATTIYAESDDGTTEVNATDTTKTLSAGSAVANRHELWIDMRDPSDVQVYVDGSLVLSGTTFNVAAATGPLGLLAHLEKTSGTATAGPVYIDRFTARFQQ